MNTYYCRLLLTLVLVVSPTLAVDNASQDNNAWYWYNNAVDLANAGKFSEALVANENALSINQTMPVAWANEAGILVQLRRYDEAITAADTVLSVNSTEMPNTYAAAYYSKADALRALGRIAEAQDAYTHAYTLDNTLVPPDMSNDISVSPTPRLPLSPTVNPPLSPTQKSPLSALLILVALGVFSGTVSVFRKK